MTNSSASAQISLDDLAVLMPAYNRQARIDAGDRSVPQRLDKQRVFMELHPQVAGLGMWTQVVTREGKPLFMLTPPAEPNEIRRLRFFRSCLAHPSMMLRVDAVRAVGN